MPYIGVLRIWGSSPIIFINYGMWIGFIYHLKQCFSHFLHFSFLQTETMNASLLRVHLECSLPNDTYQLVKVCFIFILCLCKSSSFKPSLEGTLSTALEVLAKMWFSVSQFNGELCFYKTVFPDTNSITHTTLKSLGEKEMKKDTHHPTNLPKNQTKTSPTG